MFPDLTRDDVFRLETQRLWLRWPRASDAAAIRRMVSRDEVSRQTARIPHPYPTGAAEAFILAARAANAEGRAIQLAMTLKSTQEMIGQIGARAEAGEIEVGYLVAPENWDHGYASEALTALVDVVFALTFAPRLNAQVMVNNDASAHVLEKQGFVEAGEVTADLPLRGGPRLCRRYVLERSVREGLRQRPVPAMSQQAVGQPGASRPRAPEAARGWM